MAAPVTNYTGTSDIDIAYAAKSWVQVNQDKYIWPRLPRIVAHDMRSGLSGTTTWRITAFNSAMARANAAYKWEPGQRHAPKGLLGAPITGSCTVEGIEVVGEPRVLMDDPDPYTLEDLEGNGLVDVQLSRLYGTIELQVAAWFSATNLGTAKTFTGTNPLSANESDQTPIVDIEGWMESIRAAQGLGLSAEVFMGQKTVDVLRAHRDYNAVAAASGRNIMSDEDFLALFKKHHRLDAVHVFNTVADNTAIGATPSPAFIGRRVLACVLLDRRRQVWDLKRGPMSRGPDGSLALAFGRLPTVVSDMSGAQRDETEDFYGRTSYGLCAPRNSTNDSSYTPGWVADVAEIAAS